jgi:hypothetical protein
LTFFMLMACNIKRSSLTGEGSIFYILITKWNFKTILSPKNALNQPGDHCQCQGHYQGPQQQAVEQHCAA